MARASEFFYRESKSKKIIKGGGGEGEMGGGRGMGWGVDGRTYEQAQTNLPLQLL